MERLVAQTRGRSRSRRGHSVAQEGAALLRYSLHFHFAFVPVAPPSFASLSRELLNNIHCTADFDRHESPNRARDCFTLL